MLIRILYLLLGGLLLAPAPAYPDQTEHSETHSTATIEARFIQGLSERRLDALVDAYAQQRWADPNQSDRQRAELTVAWIRALSARALASPPEKRETHWRQMAKLAASFQRRVTDSPRSLLVSLQLALARLDQGEVTLQALQTANPSGSNHSTMLSAAREALREALTQFEQIDTQIEAWLPQAYQSKHPQPDDWSVGELESLRLNVAHQTARALRLQALSYPEDSADRINSLDRALQRFQELANRQGGGTGRWQARIETVSCLRLLKRWDEAKRQLSAWEQDSPVAIQPLLTAERLFLLLAQQQTDRALASAQELLQQPISKRLAETDFAILEVLLTARNMPTQAGQHKPNNANRLTEQATWLARQIEHQYGHAWGQRALIRLGQALTTGYEDVTVLRHAAATLFTAGNLDAALATYDRAAALAHASGDRTEAFHLSQTAAAIANRAQDPQGALSRYRQLALQQPQQSAAADTHLNAVRLAATLARQAAPNSARQQAMQVYETLLQEHLQSWPQEPPADTVRWWLGRLRMVQQRWLDGADLLGRIPPDSNHYAQAVRASLKCYRHGLQSHPANLNRTHTLTSATGQWQKVITGIDNHWPAKWSPLQRTVALALARLQLVEFSAGHRYAEKLLTAALSQNDKADPSDKSFSHWRFQAFALLAAARARAGQLAAAEKLLQNLQAWAPWDAQTALSIYASLRIEQEPDRQHQLALARFVLQVFEGIKETRIVTRNGPEDASQQRLASSLSPDRLAELARARGVAHELLDQRQPALAAYQAWMEYRPKDGDAQEAYAHLLGKILSAAQTTSTTPEQFQTDQLQALVLWQQIERRSKPGGPRWRRARQARIGLLKQLNRHQQSQKLEQLTRVLYPSAL